MNYEYRRFTDYENFAAFCNKAALYHFELHSWQDCSENDIDIRAIFIQLVAPFPDVPLPEVS